MKSVIAFTVAYLAAGIAVAVATGNKEFQFYIYTLPVIMGAVVMVHRSIKLSLGLLWALSFWGLAHLAGGMLPVPQSWPTSEPLKVLYNLWIIPDRFKYDQLVHAYGFGTTTWVCWHGMRHILATRTRTAAQSIKLTFGMAVLCVAAGMGFGALNEIVEFSATLMFTNTNVGGYENTGWDLVSNMAGGILAACLIGFSQRGDEP